jgi:hypothetical protein
MVRSNTVNCFILPRAITVLRSVQALPVCDNTKTQHSFIAITLTAPISGYTVWLSLSDITKLDHRYIKYSRYIRYRTLLVSGVLIFFLKEAC